MQNRTVDCTGTMDTAAFNKLDHSDAENASEANENNGARLVVLKTSVRTGMRIDVPPIVSKFESATPENKG